MSRFRFSIAQFLTVVTLVAVGLAATASQSRVATSLAFTAFVILLGISTGGALLATGPRRAFWIGFAIFGWIYWFVEFNVEGSPAPQPVAITFFGLSGRSSSSQRAAPPPGLITGDLMNWLEATMTANLNVGTKVMAQWKGGTYYSGTITQASGGLYLIVWDDGSPQQWTPPSQIAPNSPNLRVAAHATLGGLFALAGGVLVALLFGQPNVGRASGRPADNDSAAKAPVDGTP